MRGESRVVLVSGCSTGIGRDLVRRLGVAGFTVVATARSVETLAGLEAALKLPLDVTSQDSVAATVGRVIAELGRIDALVNNAGFGVNAAVEEIRPEELGAMFEVNVIGAQRLMRAVLPGMRARGSGTIVNMSSITGLMSTATSGGYAASKQALEALSDAARQELAAFGLRVVLIEPGPIRSAFGDKDRSLSADRFSSPDSPYAWLYAKNLAIRGSMERRQPGPELVSRAILRALNSRRPKARYLVAPGAAVRFMLALPSPLQDRLFALAMRKPAS